MHTLGFGQLLHLEDKDPLLAECTAELLRGNERAVGRDYRV